VLVAIQDGRPAPKIIDFGVAKAINQQLTEHTLLTAFAQIVGTPLYMSPEQAELSPLGVDTRSDIYSLGVLLYELLTSTTPFDKERLLAASYDELRRIIREEEPPPPSARLSTLAADRAATIADRRRTDTRRLRQAVRGELDWIVMKCLEKDRNRRYESAGSLARDVERYLHDETVQACPPSAAYRLKKFIRRNKIAAAFVLLLVAAVAALAASNFQTRRSERRATTENAKAQAVSDLLQGMLRSANPDEAKDAEYTVRQLLNDFSASFRAGLVDQPEVEAEIRATIGRAYWRLGAPEMADPHLTKALELRRRLFGADHESVAEVLVDIAWCRNEQTRLPEAVEVALEALRIYRACGTTGSPVFQASAVLQRVLLSSGNLDAAEKVTQEVLAQASDSATESPDIAVILHGQADLLVQRGRYREAEIVAQQAVEMHRRLNGPGHPETAWGLLALGSALQKQRKFTEAEAAMREALAIFRQRYRGNHHSLTGTFLALKQVLAAQGDETGLDELAKAEAEQATRSESPEYDIRLAGLLLSNNPSGAQKQEARQLLRRAIDRYSQVAVDSRDELERRLKAADGYVEVAKLCAADPDLAPEIDETHRRLTAELEELLASFPDSIHCQEQVAHRYRLWALAVQDLNLVEQALREAVKLFDTVSRIEPKQPFNWFFLAESYMYLGDALWRSTKLKDAGDAFGRAMDVYDQHEAEIWNALPPANASELAYDYVRIADFLANTHRETDAAELVRKAILTAKRITDPAQMADALYYTALVQLRLRDDAGYRATCKALLEVPVDNLVGVTKSRPIWTPCLAPNSLEDLQLPVKRAEEFVANSEVSQPHFGLYLLGAAHLRAGQFEQAAERLEESIAAYPSDPLHGIDTINYYRLLLAMTKWRLGQRDAARQLLADTQPVVDKELASPSTTWNRRATLELLRREAEALIERKEAEEAVENKSQINDE
jgi:tetratricopeptide (TPR) repeat protein